MAGKLVGLGIVVLLVFVSFIPIFNVKVPYEEKVSYQDTEPYETPIKYIVDSATLNEEGLLDIWAYSNVVVRNIDDTGGTFTVTHSFYNINGLVKQAPTQAFIPAGGSYTFRVGYDKKLGENVRSQYSVAEPTKTAHRVVTKYKYETRFRDKKVSLVETLFG